MLQYSAVVGQEKRGDIKISIYFVCDSADGTLEDCDKIFFLDYKITHKPLVQCKGKACV